MIGDVVWSDGRSWTESTTGQWSGYYPGDYKHSDEGWHFTDLETLKLAQDFRWIVQEGNYLLLQLEFESTFDRLDDQWSFGSEDNHNLVDDFRDLAAALLDIGLE